MRVVKRAAVVAVLVAASTLVQAAPAYAAGTVAVSGGQLTVTATAGRANDIKILVSGANYVVDDRGDWLTAGAGCRSVAPATVWCATAGVTRIRVDAGDMDDIIALDDVFGLGHGVLVPATLIGGPGNDTIYGGAGGDVIIGGDGDDRLAGVDGNDLIDGGAGNDRLAGGPGGDLLVGGAGDDLLNGGFGNDILYGGDGNDTAEAFDAADGSDVFHGGPGNDTASCERRAGAVLVSLDGVANDGAPGEGDNIRPDVETVIGGVGDDVLIGNAADNVLIGGPGTDNLIGLAGDDVLYAADGVSGNDRVDGGAGTDGCKADPGDTRLGCEY
jgi:serralysin